MNTQNPSTNLPTVLSFEGAELKIIDHNGHPWLAAADLARALGYQRADKVTQIYERNVGEFAEGMSETLKLTVSGNLQSKARIFSPRGAHLIAMFARTAKATAFRRWVLDVLEGYDAPAALPAPPTHPHCCGPCWRAIASCATWTRWAG